MNRAILSLVAFCAATALYATFPADLSTGDLTTHADAIVIGKCTGSKSKWEDGNLFTFVDITVQEVLKGGPRKTLTVVLPGGVDLEGPVPIAQEFDGAPVIVPGEEVFLFLRALEEMPGSFAIVGFSQGKFSIRADKAGKVVSRDSSFIPFAGGRPGETTSAVSVPLPKFKQEVQQFLAANGARQSGVPGPL